LCPKTENSRAENPKILYKIGGRDLAAKLKFSAPPSRLSENGNFLQTERFQRMTPLLVHGDVDDCGK